MLITSCRLANKERKKIPPQKKGCQTTKANASLPQQRELRQTMPALSSEFEVDLAPGITETLAYRSENLSLCSDS